MGLETRGRLQFALSLPLPWDNVEHVTINLSWVGGIQRTATLDYELLKGKGHKFSFCIYPQCLAVLEERKEGVGMDQWENERKRRWKKR